MAENTFNRSKIITSVNAPLSFFTLGLLISESFLAVICLKGDLSSSQQLLVTYLGVGMFIMINIEVFILVWHKPVNLISDKKSLKDYFPTTKIETPDPTRKNIKTKTIKQVNESSDTLATKREDNVIRKKVKKVDQGGDNL